MPEGTGKVQYILCVISDLQVEYQGKGFLDKNRDTLPANIVSTLADSHCPLVCNLYTCITV